MKKLIFVGVSDEKKSIKSPPKVAYYNAKLALWEPVLEPIVSVQPDGSSIKKRWELIISIQKNADSDYGSAFVSPR